MSSHRYSPYPLPSLASSQQGGVQYSVTSPLMSQQQHQLTAGPALHTAAASQQAGQAGAGGQTGLEAQAATPSPSAATANLSQGMPALTVNPYAQAYNLANVAGVDWSSLGYSLPAMYTL